MTNNDSPGLGIQAARAWWRLEQAQAAFNAHLLREHGVTGGQLALLRIVAERQPVAIRHLRAELDWHPASLGQTAQRLVDRGLLANQPDPADRRRRLLRLTDEGEELLGDAPAVGAVRLRSVAVPDADLAVIRDGFTAALEAFGLTPWSDDVRA